jgi:hypothetical protein
MVCVRSYPELPALDLYVGQSSQIDQK